MSRVRALAATGGVFVIGSIFGARFHREIKGALEAAVRGVGYAVGMLSSLFVIRRKKFAARMFGLDQAGKTTLLYQMKLGCLVPTISTVGFNSETIAIRDIDLEVLDIGGSPKNRTLWRHYFADTDAVIFVVDCSNKDRLEEAREELHRIISDPQLKDVVLLVCANKLVPHPVANHPHYPPSVPCFHRHRHPTATQLPLPPPLHPAHAADATHSPLAGPAGRRERRRRHGAAGPAGAAAAALVAPGSHQRGHGRRRLGGALLGRRAARPRVTP
jgi:hypothetical protein